MALPAAAVGVTAGALLVRGPTDDLLRDLNELSPGGVLGWPHAVVIARVSPSPGPPRPCPRTAAARRPVVEMLRGARIRAPRGWHQRPAALIGARLAVSRPGRLLVVAVAVAGAVATILLLLALARFLVEAQREPWAIGERYSLLVEGGELPATGPRDAGVAAAAERLEVIGVDVFDLGSPLTLVALRAGGATLRGPPAAVGRRARTDDEVEVGRGLAEGLGLAPGGRLVAELEGGGESGCRWSAWCRSFRRRPRRVRQPAALRPPPRGAGRVAVRPTPAIRQPS